MFERMFDRSVAERTPEAGVDVSVLVGSGLAGMLAAAGAPGPFSAIVLDALDVEAASTDELIDAMVGWEQLASWVAARQSDVMAEFAHRRPCPLAGESERMDSVSEFAPDEIASALRIARSTAEGRMGLALHLRRRLPATLSALSNGEITSSKARILGEQTAHMSLSEAVAVGGCRCRGPRPAPRS
jgi:hypothetical protein